VKPKVKKSPLVLATAGHYEDIDWDNLTQKDVQEKSETGVTLLHQAARDGFFKKIPQGLRDKKYWVEAIEGTTVYISAYLGSDNSWIDKKNITTQDLLKQNTSGDSIATLAIEKGTFQDFPKEIITLDVLTQKIKCDKGDTLLHKLARRGQLPLVPKIFLTEEILLTKGTYGESIFHIVAENRHYGNIQKNQWTRAAMTLEADNGTTPLHHICASSCGLVSKDITLDDMLAQTDAGSTPLHKWAASNRWYKIHDRFLTKEALELEVDFEKSPLQLIAQGYESSLKSSKGLSRQIPEEDAKFKTVLSKISDRALHGLTVKGYHTIPLVKKEMLKRKLCKHFSNKDQNLEI